MILQGRYIWGYQVDGKSILKYMHDGNAVHRSINGLVSPWSIEVKAEGCFRSRVDQVHVELSS